MSFRTASRTSLALGAALLACPLSASAGGPPPMQIGTLDSAAGYLSLAGNSGNFSVAGPSNAVAYTKPVDSGSGFIDVVAAAYGDTGGLVFATLSLGGFSYGTYGGQGSFTLNFSTAVTFTDFGYLVFGTLVTFTSGGETILDGHVFEAGIHTIDWVFGGNLVGVANITGVGMLFSSSGGSVPLPGAAVLAAAGLAGLGRRRRR